jgi:hypothetical protein
MEFKLKKFSNHTEIKTTKAINVYNNKLNGIGDYIRGCFCMLQLSKKLNIPFDMDLSTNPVHQFLHPVQNLRTGPMDTDNHIAHFVHVGVNINNELKLLINKLRLTPGTYSCFCNLYPFNPIIESERIFIRNKLLPSHELNAYIQQTKEALDVTSPYNVLHLRCGDDCLENNAHPDYDLFIREIQALRLDSKPCILLCDSSLMKIRLRELYPSLKMLIDTPQHTRNSTKDQLKDTMRDFFLFTQASKVYSLSVYGHGSGFSEWACQLYNIPYRCKHVHP